jgi:two-component system, OmpR family, sensor histidine kinase CreC
MSAFIKQTRIQLHHILSIRRILAGISLLFLILPVGGLYLMKIYESALIRQTESELISQAAFVAALYRHEMKSRLSPKEAPYGLPLTADLDSGSMLHPILPRLDLAKDMIFPARPLPQVTTDRLHPLAKAVGQDIGPILRDAQQRTLAGIKILDYQGLVVSGAQEQGLSFAHTEEFVQARHGKAVSLLRRRRKKHHDPMP